MDNSQVVGSITALLKKLPTGNPDVVHEVFHVYFNRLAGLARRLIQERGGARLADEEDLASIVLTAFLRDATAGDLGELRSRHDVWRMLAKRLRLRASNLVRDDYRKKRAEVGESVFRKIDGGWDPNGIAEHAGRNLDDLRHFYDEILAELDCETQREIAKLLLEGLSVDEISVQLKKSPATIYRKIELIKKAWGDSSGQAITT
jgi:DNA-directed RNA polymerase specialized sigma24 family protein